MGLTHFWNEFGGGEETANLFQHAEDHFKKHGRPFRVAVDFAYWYNHSVGQEKTIDIRVETNRLSNPIEKNSILYPALRCFKHGIQLIFVFDGKGRPTKRGRKITAELQAQEDKRNELAKATFRALQIPCRDAPGEAEAECVSLERAGLVDAVWTDDSDAFMFGSITVIRHAYESRGGVKHKSSTHVRLYKAADIAKHLGLPENHDKDAVKDALILYAILVGSDYNMQGVSGCGSKTACKVMRDFNGERILWGTALVKAYKTGRLEQWRQEFEKYCVPKGIKCPTTSALNPTIAHLYIEPKVSPTQGRGILWSPSSTISALNLRGFLIQKYNFSVHDYLRIVSPTLLVRKLLSNSGQDTAELKIGVSSGGSRKESGNVPHWAVSYDIESFIPRDVLETWPAKDTKASAQIRSYEHNSQASTEVLDWILRYSLPDVMAGKVCKRAPPVRAKKASPEQAPPKSATTPTRTDVRKQVPSSGKRGTTSTISTPPAKRVKPGTYVPSYKKDHGAVEGVSSKHIVQPAPMGAIKSPSVTRGIQPAAVAPNKSLVNGPSGHSKEPETKVLSEEDSDFSDWDLATVAEVDMIHSSLRKLGTGTSPVAALPFRLGHQQRDFPTKTTVAGCSLSHVRKTQGMTASQPIELE